MQNYQLKIRQLDKQLAKILAVFNGNIKYDSWFKIIREALGMPTRYLAKKMNISPGRVSQLQKGEIDGSITLRNLEKLANSLECKLVYAFVPAKSIDDIIEAEAKKIAREKINIVSHSMNLENQGTNQEALKAQYEELVKALRLQNPKKLWRY